MGIDLKTLLGKEGKYEAKLQQLSTAFLAFVDKYSIVVAGIVIYIYFILSSFDLMRTRDVSRTALDYLLQFDSLILTWVIAVVVIQLQKYRKQTREQDEYRQRVQLEYDRQRTKLHVVDEITSLLQDNINNPLAIISVSSQNLHRKHDADPETTAWLDRIDTALQRVHTTINDIKAYQTQKIVQEAISAVEGKDHANPDVMGRLNEIARANTQIARQVEEEAPTGGS